MSSTTSPLIVPISNATTTNCHPSATRGSSLLTTMPSTARGPSLSTQVAWPRSSWLGSRWPGSHGLGHVGLGRMTRSHWPGSHSQVALAQVVQPSRTGLGRAAQVVVRVYFLIFGFSIRSVFILDFVLGFFGTLEV